MNSRNLRNNPDETLTASGAGAVNSSEVLLSGPAGDANTVEFTITPTGCTVTDCVVQRRRVKGGTWINHVGGSDYAATDNPAVKWSSVHPNSLTTTVTGDATVDLFLGYSWRLVITVNGAGTVAVTSAQGNL